MRKYKDIAWTGTLRGRFLHAQHVHKKSVSSMSWENKQRYNNNKNDGNEHSANPQIQQKLNRLTVVIVKSYEEKGLLDTPGGNKPKNNYSERQLYNVAKFQNI